MSGPLNGHLTTEIYSPEMLIFAAASDWPFLTELRSRTLNGHLTNIQNDAAKITTVASVLFTAMREIKLVFVSV